ncbi:sterile alpha motif domain-containing protein 14 isoform X2 [Phyllopteryx taeniolatus]|uniref:sterile alpha motif domain-containing protein 14 isoform X2 n=1 Tax=Phyllopteryx taeniolatus TaxID=161469 RepID=UPI002AD2325D|nr:sterile alpha motif domain-containing protein 14 isoform X2 [Phyllopteryx taeniolatus]
MSAGPDDSDSVFELNSVIPETELLDNSIQKGRAQLTRRHRPSRSHCHDSVSSNDGDDSPDGRQDSATSSAHSPLQVTMRGSSPSPDSLLSPRSSAFSFDTSLVRRLPDEAGLSLAGTPRARYHQLTDDTSQEALATPTSALSKSWPASSDASPVYTRRSKRPDSEVLVSESSRDSSPADPGPVPLDQKTRRRFLDLGVTLRRSYLRAKKDKRAGEAAGGDTPESLRERESSSSRASSVSFSWFSSSGTPPGSPQTHAADAHAHPKSRSQESTWSEDFSRPPTSPSGCPHVELSASVSAHPYRTLSQSSDEPGDEPSCPAGSWTSQQVCEWLRDLSMDRYVPEFRAGDVDGRSLLRLDGGKLKVLRRNREVKSARDEEEEEEKEKEGEEQEEGGGRKEELEEDEKK